MLVRKWIASAEYLYQHPPARYFTWHGHLLGEHMKKLVLNTLYLTNVKQKWKCNYRCSHTLLCPCSSQETSVVLLHETPAIISFQVVIQLNWEYPALVRSNNIIWKLAQWQADVVSQNFLLWANVLTCISSETHWILFLAFTLTVIFLQNITWIFFLQVQFMRLFMTFGEWYGRSSQLVLWWSQI